MKKRGGNGAKDEATDAETFHQALRMVVIGTIIACIGLSLRSAASDDQAPAANLLFYLGVAGLPFLAAWALALKDGPWMSVPFSHSFLRNAVVVLVGIGILVYAAQTWGPANTLLHLATYASLFMLAVFALAMVFNVFSNFFLRQGGAMGFLIRLVFYLPCVVLDVVQTLHGELRTSPKTLWILLGLEALAVGVYLSSTQWLRYLHRMHLPGSITLLPGPVFFQNPQRDVRFASALDVTPFPPEDVLGAPKVQASYSIALWILMNPDTTIFSERTVDDLFTYGSTTQGYHPALRYVRRSKKDHGNTFWLQTHTFEPAYRSLDRTNDAAHYAFQLPPQRWNFLVFTYQEGNVELFINGELHRTFANDTSVTPQDVFVMGSEVGTQTNGSVDGALANVQYFQTPLTRTQVANMYNFRVSQPTVAWDPLVHRATMLS